MSKDIAIAILALATAGAIFTMYDMFKILTYHRYGKYFWSNWIISCIIFAGCIVIILGVIFFGGL